MKFKFDHPLSFLQICILSFLQIHIQNLFFSLQIPTLSFLKIRILSFLQNEESDSPFQEVLRVVARCCLFKKLVACCCAHALNFCFLRVLNFESTMHFVFFSRFFSAILTILRFFTILRVLRSVSFTFCFSRFCAFYDSACFAIRRVLRFCAFCIRFSRFCDFQDSARFTIPNRRVLHFYFCISIFHDSARFKRFKILRVLRVSRFCAFYDSAIF